MRRTAIWGALLAAALGSGCDVVSIRGDGSGAEAPARASAPEAPPAPIAKAPTTQELLRACPLESVLFADLRKSLEAGRFEEVDAIAERMLAAHRQTAACESPLWETVGFLATLETPLLDRWVAARPDSWPAFASRGAHFVEKGYASRGTRFSKYVTEQQWADMAQAFARAQGDLSRALELEPDAYPAYGYAIYMLKSAGQPREIEKWLAALLARDPLNYGVRRRAMQSLDVMWGGSLEQQRAIADEAQRYADGNPRLRILPGYVEAQVGQTAFRAKKYDEAAAAYRRALAHGALHDWYAMLGDSLIWTDSWQELLAVSDQWLAELGDYSTPRQYRGRALAELGQIEAARADLEKAAADTPDHAGALRWLGLAQRRAGMPKEALASYRRALELEPDEAWTLEQIASLEQAEAQREHSAAAAKARAAAPEPAARTLPALSRIPLTPAQS